MKLAIERHLGKIGQDAWRPEPLTKKSLDWIVEKQLPGTHLIHKNTLVLAQQRNVGLGKDNRSRRKELSLASFGNLNKESSRPILSL